MSSGGCFPSPLETALADRYARLHRQKLGRLAPPDFRLLSTWSIEFGLQRHLLIGMPAQQN